MYVCACTPVCVCCECYTCVCVHVHLCIAVEVAMLTSHHVCRCVRCDHSSPSFHQSGPLLNGLTVTSLMLQCLNQTGQMCSPTTPQGDRGE